MGTPGTRTFGVGRLGELERDDPAMSFQLSTTEILKLYKRATTFHAPEEAQTPGSCSPPWLGVVVRLCFSGRALKIRPEGTPFLKVSSDGPLDAVKQK